MGCFVKKVENGGVVKKWTFPQRRVYSISIFLFYILLIWGVYAPPPLPTGLDNHHIQRLSMAIYAYAVYISESTATCKPGDE